MIIFYAFQVMAGLFLAILGVAMIEDQSFVFAMIGALLSVIGFLVMVTFTMLIDRELKKGA